MDDITEYRLYTFGNFYLSSIQQGIQAAHALGELFLKYNRGAQDGTTEKLHLINWAEDHKTMICKNGGAEAELLELIRVFNTDKNPYPWSFFEEEQAALNGACTCVAIVVPDTIYDRGIKLYKAFQKGTAQYHYNNDEGIHMYTCVGKSYIYSDFEFELIEQIRNSRNAI